MLRSASLRRIAPLPLGLLLMALGGGCQLLAGLGGEETKGGGATGATSSTGGTGGTGGGTSTGTGGTGLTGTCSPGDETPCYGGPAGTEGEGVCAAGVSKCGDDGTWGPCEGAVVPSAELCANAADEDCDGLDCNVWVKWVDSEVYGEAVGIDAAGNVYAAIAVHSGVDLGDGDPVVPVGNSDAVVLKLDRGGAIVWKKQIKASGDQFIRAISVAPDGSFAIGGDTSASIDFMTGQGPISGSEFVAKFDADGNATWAIGVTGNGAYVTQVALDAAGNVFVGGSGTSVDLGAGLATAESSNGNIFIGKLAAASGQQQWLKITKGTGDQSLNALLVDPSNSAVLLGTMTSTYLGFTDAGGTPPNDLFNGSPNGTFLARFDPDGGFSDGKIIYGSPAAAANAYLKDLAVDPIGNSIIVGEFTGAVGFGESSFDAGSNQALVVVHDKTSGFMQSANFFEVPNGYVAGNFVGLDSESGISVAGNYGGAPNFGGGPLPESGSSYLLKLDKDGAFLWNRSFVFGDGGIQNLATGTAEDETVLIGTFYGTADLGLGPHSAQQGLFIAKFGK